MKTYKNRQLRKRIRLKGISLNGVSNDELSKSDYFQTVNAYKFLFATGQETLDEIFANINNGLYKDDYRKHYQIGKKVPDSELKVKICQSILDRYGIGYESGELLNSLKTKIDKISYTRHIYDPSTQYKDFLRMYYLEHDLRNVLLKYVLMIEEKIKAVFISVLNEENTKDNYLTDIKNYNLTGNYSKNSLFSLKEIISMHSKVHSKPIKRKMDQQLTVPYWILINSMTMNQTVNTIKNLNKPMSDKIFLSLFKMMTNYTAPLDIENNQSDLKLLNDFRRLLRYVGEFRNILAHNQLLYCYNVDKHFSTISYSEPVLDRKSAEFKKNAAKGLSYDMQQKKRNVTLMSTVSTIYGVDAFSKRTSDVDINLSFIIYIVNRMIKCIYKDISFREEVMNIFKEYNVFISYNKGDFKDVTDVIGCCKEISELDVVSLENQFNDILESIAKKKPHKRKEKAFKRDLDNVFKSIQNSCSAINTNIKKSKYDYMNERVTKFTKYTGINRNFITNILY